MTQYVINRDTREKVLSNELHRYIETGQTVQKPYDVGALINAIIIKGESITADMNEWIAVANAIANCFGEAGRELFHDISRMDNSYSKTSANIAYNRAIKNPHANINLLVGRAQKLGINTNDFWINDETDIPQIKIERKEIIKKDPFFIPFEYVQKSNDSLRKHSIFVKWFYDILGDTRQEQAKTVLLNYYVGATTDKRVIFWKIDKEYNVTAGKVMQYDESGHRDKKNEYSTTSIHHILAKQKIFDEKKYERPTQSLFGAHLLNTVGYNNKNVAIVESEKTALICAVIFPDFVWLGAGSYTMLNDRKRTECLKGKNVILYPDTNKHNEWIAIAEELKGFCNITVSNYLINNATEEEKAKGIDIADLIIKDLQEEKTAKEEKTKRSEILINQLKENYKGFDTFYDKLQLQIEDESE